VCLRSIRGPSSEWDLAHLLLRMARGELLVLARAGQVGEERKKVLKICVSKLQTIHDPEAFLCRSVLINNTLRQIQEEHRQGQRRARLKRARHVVEEEEEEGVDDRRVQISVDNFDEAEVEGVSSKRFCPEPEQLEADSLISPNEGCPMSTAYYEDGIYKEEVLQTEKCSDSLGEDGDEVDEEDDETDIDEEEEDDDDDEEEEDGEEEEGEEEEEEEDAYDLPLEETPMLGSIEISVVSTAFTDEPERKTDEEEEEEVTFNQLADSEEDETSSSSEEGGAVGLYHCPYSLLLPSSPTSQVLPSINCAL